MREKLKNIYFFTIIIMENNLRIKSIKNPGKNKQLLATIILNTLTFSYGTMVGWVSPMTPVLQSSTAPSGLEGMSNEMISWLTGTLCIGGFVTTFPVNISMDKFGRKLVGCLIPIPAILCWLFTIFASQSYHLLIGRFFAGVTGSGTFLMVPIFVAEIANDSNRGMLGSLLIFFINAGILFSYTFGSLLSYHNFAMILTIFPIIYLIGFTLMPETPIYLMRCNRLNEATRSLLWYNAGDQLIVEQKLHCLQMSIEKTNHSTKSVGFLRSLQTKAVKRGLMISLSLFISQQFSGIFVMLTYATTIFELTGSSLSSSAAAIIIATIQVIGSYLSTYFIESTGRKLLLLISYAGMFLCHYVLGFYILLKILDYDVSNFGWISIIALSTYIIVYSLGAGPIPTVITTEIFNQEITSHVMNIDLCVIWFMAFFITKFFPNCVSLIGIHGCFFFFGTSCAISFIWNLLMVPETKGRTRESLINELGKSK